MFEKAKIAYLLLKSRMDFALSKNQIDKEGFVYFEFTGQKFAYMMNCSERKVNRIKKQLEEKELLI